MVDQSQKTPVISVIIDLFNRAFACIMICGWACWTQSRDNVRYCIAPWVEYALMTFTHLSSRTWSICLQAVMERKASNEWYGSDRIFHSSPPCHMTFGLKIILMWPYFKTQTAFGHSVSSDWSIYLLRMGSSTERSIFPKSQFCSWCHENKQT